MTKSPEEGKIWEWRGFGKISRSVAALIEAMPIRSGIRELPATDIYLIPPVSEQNVKLRLTDRGWVLKFKLLLEQRPDGIELYHESARWTFPFPIKQARLQEAANLLDVRITEAWLQRERFTRELVISALVAATPAIRSVEVKKVRSQYQFEGGWLESANVNFGNRQVQSLSLHSSKIGAVNRMIERLHPDSGLIVMNYVEACRRLSEN